MQKGLGQGLAQGNVSYFIMNLPVFQDRYSGSSKPYELAERDQEIQKNMIYFCKLKLAK